MEFKYYEKYEPPEEVNVTGIAYVPKWPIMDNTPLRPCKLFDNLYFIGTAFVGCFILQTEDGLVMLDSMNSRMDVENVIIPGMKELGLVPEHLKIVIASHGHFDHFGGSRALQEMFHCQVMMSKIDSEFMKVCPLMPDGYQLEFPKIDRYLDEGDTVTLGGETIRVYFTPGHTPGGLSFMLPVYYGTEKHTLMIWGGTNPPADLAGVYTYVESAGRFEQQCIDAGCDVEFSAHPFVDYSIDKMEEIRQMKAGDPHPLVIGTDGVSLFMKIIIHAAKQKIKTMGKNN